VAGLRRLLQETREIWAEFRIVPERIIDAGDRVVVIEAIEGLGRGSGVRLESRSASIWTLDGGKITRLEIGHQPDAALRAVGLPDV
jgi:ketosteroid isomerase-like protein